MTKMSRIMVHGKPFLTLGGQTHNSSSYIPDRMDPSFASIKAIGGNTMATPIPWDAFEPEEGKFNTELVTGLIDRARREGIKLSLLWFATWKNGTMEYCPAWVKRDTEKFPRVLLKDGTVALQLSAHAPSNLEADKKAFTELCRILKEYDSEEQTVIAIQIENEAGILAATRRDFGPYGEAAFKENVPAELTDYCKQYPDSLLGKIWAENGKKENAGWVDTFGYYGAEALSARAIASYIDEICRAGKEILPDTFMYLNVWLSGGSRGMQDLQDTAGLGWPAGCAVIQNLDVYYATLKYIDTVAPDNYNAVPFRHREVTDAYANPDRGFPLYVPESGARGYNLGQMFYAFAEKKAIGYHIFGSESSLAEDRVSPNAGGKLALHNFTMLKNVEPLLFDYQDRGKVRSAVQEQFETGVVLHGFDGNLRLKVGFSKNDGAWESSDFRHRGMKPEDKDNGGGRALIFQESEKVFYFVGEAARITFEEQPPMDGSIPTYHLHLTLQQENAEYISVTEGHFDENGKYQIDIVRSGDEVRHGIWLTWDVGVVRVELR